MPHIRMTTALSIATIEESSAQQFVLSHLDYLTFTAVPHPQASSFGQPKKWQFAGIAVVEATDEDASSLLHVIGSRPVFTNPIPV